MYSCWGLTPPYWISFIRGYGTYNENFHGRTTADVYCIQVKNIQSAHITFEGRYSIRLRSMSIMLTRSDFRLQHFCWIADLWYMLWRDIISIYGNLKMTMHSPATKVFDFITYKATNLARGLEHLFGTHGWVNWSTLLQELHQERITHGPRTQR